jgi:outer membrane lipoprotein-sorting protein
VHPNYHASLDFHLARVFLDDELKMPIRYEAYGWPESPGAKPPLLEEYTYMDIKVNVGLADTDFDPSNPKYRF